jgi:hypothetical protein
MKQTRTNKTVSISLIVMLGFMVIGMVAEPIKAQTVYTSIPSIVADSNTAFYTSNHWASQQRNYLLNGYWYTFYQTKTVITERYGYSADGVNWQTLAVPGISTVGPLNFGVALTNSSFHFSFGNTTGLYYGTLNSGVNGVLTASNISLIFNGNGKDYNVFPEIFNNIFVDNLGIPWVTYTQVTGTVGNYTGTLYIDHSNATVNNVWVSANGIFPYNLGNVVYLDTAFQNTIQNPLASMVSYSDNTNQFIYALSYYGNLTSRLFNSTSQISNFTTTLATNGFETNGYSAQHNLVKTSDNRVFWLGVFAFTNGTGFQGLMEFNKTALVKVLNVYPYWGAYQLALLNNSELVIQGTSLNYVTPENITVKFYNLTSNILSSEYLVVPNALQNTYVQFGGLSYYTEWSEGIQLSKTADSNGTYLMTYIHYPDEKLYSVLVNFYSNIEFPIPPATPTPTPEPLSRADTATNNVFNNMYIAVGLIGVSFIVLAFVILFSGFKSDGDTSAMLAGLLLLIGGIAALIVGVIIVMSLQNSII